VGFLNVDIFDIIDILLVAYLFYQLYLMIKGSVAINIFIGIFITYLIWLFVKALNMELLSSILGQVMGLGVIALIIVFQQEIRKFLIVLGNRYFSRRNFTLEQFLSGIVKREYSDIQVDEIMDAVKLFAKSKTGALIGLVDKTDVENFVITGEVMDCRVSSRILQSIFFKNAPMHDGAMFIKGSKILAAKCVLPVSEKTDLPSNIGLRHRSAVGLSEVTDCLVIIVSEERGEVSYAEYGSIYANISINLLREKIIRKFNLHPGI